MFPISPGFPPIITESFLNCQIELSRGHLFNKHCLVYYNEMEKKKTTKQNNESRFLSGGHLWNLRFYQELLESISLSPLCCWIHVSRMHHSVLKNKNKMYIFCTLQLHFNSNNLKQPSPIKAQCFFLFFAIMWHFLSCILFTLILFAASKLIHRSLSQLLSHKCHKRSRFDTATPQSSHHCLSLFIYVSCCGRRKVSTHHVSPRHNI